LNSGMNEAALMEEEAALAVKPGSPSARMNRALVWGALGRLRESTTELANLSAANPNDERIHQAWQYVQSLSQPSANKQVQFFEGGR
jgi:predicted Zn-dependent protease